MSTIELATANKTIIIIPHDIKAKCYSVIDGETKVITNEIDILEIQRAARQLRLDNLQKEIPTK